MRRERPGQSLQATALVHEAYLRLLKDEDLSFQNRAHFLGIAARSMRQILVEHARARDAEKRGGERRAHHARRGAWRRASRETSISSRSTRRSNAWPQQDPNHARIVELRFFGGLTNEEAAEALGISPATVKRGWAVARAWLFRETDSA